MKRSVSPQTVLENDSPTKKRKGFGFFSTLKRAFSGITEKQEKSSETNNFIDQDVFPRDFTSRKRRESVIEELKSMSQHVPRSSSIVGLATYQTLRNSLQSEKEAISGDLEQRRMSMVGVEEDVLMKEQSPTFNIVPRNQILPTNLNEMVLEEDAGLPLVIEHEFAPLYKDAEGNLVRPPFINLDPRERYHLLQLKKSIEASEFLQNRLKYMIDPDETTSVIKPNNKVESSTQTYNKDFLDRSLRFNAVRTKLALTNRKNKRTKRGCGMFSGEFYYEPIEPKSIPQAEVAESKLNGYLGKLSLPAFKSAPTNSGPKPFPDDDSSKESTNRQKSTSQRAGLEESIRTGQAKDAVLDDDYVKKTEKISNIIKLKDQPASMKKATVGPGSGFNFEISKKDFGSILQTRKDDEELVQKSSTPILPGSSKQLFSAPQSGTTKSLVSSEKTPLFGGAPKLTSLSKEESKAPKPAFSLNISRSTDQEKIPETKLDNTASKPLFGASNTDTSKGAFDLGSRPTEVEKKPVAEKPQFSFGSKPVDSDAPKPSFSFGKQASSSLSEQSKIPSFGAGVSVSTPPGGEIFGSKPSEKSGPQDNSEAPKFSFGEKKDTPKFSFGEKKEAPKFSFGEKKEEPKFSGEKEEPKFSGEKEEPKFSFGDKKEAPTFSFGKKTGESKLPSGEKKDLPSLSFGKVDSAPSTPSFSFGDKKPDTPAFNFGSKTETKGHTSEEGSVTTANTKDSEGPKTPATSISFGSSAPASEQNVQLGLKRGHNDEPDTKRTRPGASSTFGSKSTTEIPKFLFSTTGAAVPSGLSFDSVDGKKDNSEPPNFSFGQTVGNKTETNTPAFSFGNKEAPSFNFGQKGGDVAKETTSVFSFSSKETTPKPQTESKPAFSFGNAPASSSSAQISFGKPSASQPAQAMKPSFSFGSSATADPALIFGGGAQAPGFNFSAPATKPGESAFGSSSTSFGAAPTTPFSFGNSNALAAPTPQSVPFGGAFGGANGISATPTPGFGQNSQMPNPASVFGGGNAGQTPGFSFSSGNFNSAPGSFGLASRENTPPVFGGNPAMGQVPGQPFTPPLAKQGRKIAQMRPRKRF
ncbi:CIC11C00000004127 [Sungouiella intermedia]|uniref:CIC11C00000004127 n=1 Tax=Sungouiella intermedia TaxID=45354 RepID=A0A1L0DEB6_9ASCO|nr:CIC11C00000004127 [[Candida] intermedia]